MSAWFQVEYFHETKENVHQLILCAYLPEHLPFNLLVCLSACLQFTSLHARVPDRPSPVILDRSAGDPRVRQHQPVRHSAARETAGATGSAPQLQGERLQERGGGREGGKESS